MQKLNNSSAKEPISTQCANKRAAWILGTIKSRSPVNCQNNCKHLSADHQRSYCSNSLMSRLLTALQMAEKTKPVSFHQRKRIPHHNRAFPVLKTHKYPHQVERSCKLGVLKQQQASKQHCYHLKY